MRTASLLSILLLAAAPIAEAQPVRHAPPKPVPTKTAPAASSTSVYARSSISDWTKPPEPGPEPTFKPPVAQRMKLRNGLSLLVVENHALPIVSMQLVAPGAGAANDPKGKGGLAAYTADLLDEGAAGMSAIEIAEEIDRLGASIALYTDTDAGYVAVSTLSKTLDPTIDLVTKLLTQPAFDPTESERVKGDRLTSLELRRDRPREVASIMLNGAIFGIGTPYGHPVTGVREEFKNLTVADARAFYKQRWNPATMTLVVAGDVDATSLKRKLDASLGAWKQPGAQRATTPKVSAAKVTNRLLFVDRKGAAQSDVRIGLLGPDRKDRRYYAFEVFRTVLGDGFTSRLVQRLREQLGITYGANASMDWRLARGPFVIGTAIVTAATAQGVKEILDMVAALATTNVPAEELEKSKQNLIRALPEMFATNASTAAAYADLALFGLPDNWYTTYAANIRKVTAKDVKAAAAAFAPVDKLVISIVGDLATFRAELDKLGLGRPAMFDLYGTPLGR
jgi:zinc protease